MRDSNWEVIVMGAVLAAGWVVMFAGPVFACAADGCR